ncbi:MAG: hypothetical protein ACOYIG_04495, partial [Acetivibrionales bacterium]
NNFTVTAQDETIPQQVQDWQKAAQEALQQKNYEAAHGLYTNIITAYPGTEYAMDAQHHRVILFLQQDRKEQADAAVENMWSYGGHAGIVSLLVRIKGEYWRKGFQKESQALCHRIMDAYPSNPDTAIVHRDAIDGYIAMKDLAQANTLLEAFWQRYGNREDVVNLLENVKTEYWLRGYRNESQALCERIMAAYPDNLDTAAIHRDAIAGYVAMKDITRANALLETFWQRYGNREDLGELLGHVMREFWAQGYQKESLALGERVMEAYPNSPFTTPVHRDAIVRCLATKNIAQANVLLETFWQRYGSREDAVSLFERIKTDYWDHGYRNESQVLCERIIAAYPNNPAAAIIHRDAISGYVATKDLAKAGALLETFWQRYRGREDFTALLDRVVGEYWVHGYRQESQALRERIMAAFPNNPSIVMVHKDAIPRYLEMKNLTQANALLETFWERYRGHEDIVSLLRHLKTDYWDRGYRNESQALCERIMAAYPDNPNTALIYREAIGGYTVLKNITRAQALLETFCARYNSREDIVNQLEGIKTDYWRHGFYEESQALCKRIVLSYPNHPVTAGVHKDFICGQIELHQEADAWKELEIFWSKYQAHTDFIPMTRQIVSYFRNKGDDLGGALELTFRLLGKFPEHEQAILLERDIIEIYLAFEDKNKADDRLVRLFESYAGHPLLPITLNGLGNAYRGHKYYDEAIRIHALALALRPNDTEQLCAYTGTAQCNVRLQAIPQVMETADVIVGQFAGHANTVNSLFVIGEEFYFVGSESGDTTMYSHAINVIAKAIKIAGSSSAAAMPHYLAGLCYRSLDEYGKAADAFNLSYQANAQFQHADYCCFAIADSYERLAQDGVVSQTEAESVISDRFAQLVERYPNSKYAPIARRYLDRD